jgi:nucleotide-binding universal stress UspA family protein
MMFTTIAVTLDLSANGDRALPVVRTLSELGDVDVELLTVDSPNVPRSVDDFELSRRATANGWPAHSYASLRSNDVAAAIVDHVRGRNDVLLVMATTAKRPLVGHLLGSIPSGPRDHRPAGPPRRT